MDHAARALARAALDADALRAIAAHAAATWPEECCGFVADDGLRRCANDADACHAADPAAFPRTAQNGFRLAARDLLALARSFDGNAPARVLYHSHPDAPAWPSDADIAGATFEGRAVWPGLAHLVVSVVAGTPVEAALFDLDDGAPVLVARYALADVERSAAPIIL